MFALRGWDRPFSFVAGAGAAGSLLLRGDVRWKFYASAVRSANSLVAGEECAGKVFWSSVESVRQFFLFNML